MSTILHLEDISFSQSNQKLLNTINLSVSKGQVVGLLGVNGAGKSTTLKIAAGILMPSSGKVSRPHHIRCSYVPEQPPLIPHWTVIRFLKHACALYSIEKDKQEESILSVVDQCQLHKILNKRCSALSKGNQQRVSLAQALLNKPELLLLDEPTSGLDPQQINVFRNLLNTIKSETAIIFSSHIMQEVTALCDNAIVLHDGHQIGHLDLSSLGQQLLITFEHTVKDDVFIHCNAWQSSKGNQHYFILNQNSSHNDVLAYCLDKDLSIINVTGASEKLENELLTLINNNNHSSEHA